FSLNTGGSSKVIKLEVDALKIGLNCGGSSSVNLAGKYAKCELDLGGTSKAYLMVDAAELEAEIGGTSKLEATGEFTSVEIEAAGTSKVTAKGKCDDMELYLSGTASVNTLEMPANDIKIEASGASRAKVNVEKSIKASLGGASGVSYMADSDIEMHPEVSKGASFKRIQ
ncbi:MAG: DUF2807 domain-containing protein, partial [Bacteroidales bacterium]|nr:DUF2807 domain-containing protein [Bacteroidales bacterium]